MSGFAQVVAKWGPVLIQYLPQILKVGQDIYALWCGVKGTKEENARVQKAMKLLNHYRDDVSRLLEDPEQKRALLEGLTILMNRITEHDQRQPGGRRETGPGASPLGGFSGGDSKPFFPSASASASSFPSKSSGKPGDWKVCEVCYLEYNMTYRKPTLLSCGHTFCRECLESEVRVRRNLSCPKCKVPEGRPLAALPLNYALVGSLREDNDDDDDACCSRNGYDGASCGNASLTFEEQIERAIQLSQEEAQNHGSSYVEDRWREVLEEEDLMLAEALQLSEIYEASRQFAEGCCEGATGGGCADVTEGGCEDVVEGRSCADRMKQEEEEEEEEEDDGVCAKRECDERGDCKKGEEEEKEGKEKCCAWLEDEEDLLIQMAIRASLEEHEPPTPLAPLTPLSVQK